MTLAGLALTALAVLGLAAVFLLYPLALWLLPARRRIPDAARVDEGHAQPPRVSVIVAARNAEALVVEKLANFRQLTYPRERIEMVLASDGSTDDTVRLATEGAGADVRVVALPEHGGKHVALNAAVEQASGDILVFSDVDALIEPGALEHLVAHMRDPAIGGVTGRRMIGEARATLVEAQTDYVVVDSGLKALETRHGSVTSNDGKLFAIRRELFAEVPPGVTDDLHTALAVVEQGSRFVYEPAARAWIRTPSRSRAHEVSRRRRIVCRSLRGIWRRRAVLDPRRTGRFALGLATNKIGRRLVPFFLLALMFGTALLAADEAWARWALAAQALAYAGALVFPLAERLPAPRALLRVGSAANYFVLGMVGTLLGVLDFVRGREVARWNPVKEG